MSDKIDAKLVAKLRAATGAGLMACKKALVETSGDFDQAADLLRKKGEATAAKKADREASEGIIDSYIHLGGKVGVLVEINCETDFVAKNDDFKELARDIAMHIAAVAPVCVSREEIPQELIDKEKEIAVGQAEGKPEQAIQKIVEGKLNKYCASIALLEQPFVKNGELTIQELLTQKISKLGENIKIKRFSRFEIGA